MLSKPSFKRMDVLGSRMTWFSRYATNSIGMGYDAYVVKRWLNWLQKVRTYIYG